MNGVAPPTDRFGRHTAFIGAAAMVVFVAGVVCAVVGVDAGPTGRAPTTATSVLNGPESKPDVAAPTPPAARTGRGPDATTTTGPPAPAMTMPRGSVSSLPELPALPALPADIPELPCPPGLTMNDRCVLPGWG